MAAAFTTLDNVALRELATAQVFEKYVQKLVHVNGKGVDESYINASGENLAGISIPHVPLGEGGFRLLGSTINGGQFNGKDAVTSGSDYSHIPILYVYDRVEKLAKIMNDKAGYALLDAKTSNIVLKITRGINALTLAVQLARCLNDSYAGGEALYITQEASNNSMYDNFVDANAKLGNGDEAIGADYFPAEFREAIFTEEGWAELKKEKNKFIYSDTAQEMLATGVLNPFTNSEASKVQLRDGYRGLVDGVPCYTLSNVIWKLATQNCRFTTSNLGLAPFAFDDFKGVVVSGVGTLRGFASLANIEVVPAQEGQGWVLQPLVHGGCVCISGKSVRPIVKNGFTNPVVSDATKIAILPPESNTDKLFVTIGDAGTSGDTKNKASVTVKNSKGETVTGCTIYDAISTSFTNPTTVDANATITVTSTNKKATAYAAKDGYISSDVVKKELVYTA